MAAFGQGIGWPLELGYLAEFRVMKELGFVCTFQEYADLPAFARADMRLVAEIQAAHAQQQKT